MKTVIFSELAFELGALSSTPASGDYKTLFRFTGGIKSVAVKLL